MKRKLAVADLICGMYICELDRPWLESKCLFQGVFIETQEQLQELKGGCLRECRYVVIDTLKGADLPLPKQAPPSVSKPEQSGEMRYPRAVSVERELEPARAARTRAGGFIDQVFREVASGQAPRLEDVRGVIEDLVDSIVRNPDAQMCLTQLKNRDEYTAQHSVNVCVLSLAFGRHLGFEQSQLHLLGTGALLHDIGKLNTPLEILNKPGRLTDDEFRIMKEHPERGREILRGMPAEVIDVAYSHHERLQGHGYPRGLETDQISIWSKMVAIVDVYDAITSDRVYHEGMASTDALARMYEWRERDFDAELLEQFIQCVGIYPIGSLVELSSGEVGVVISINPRLRLRPKLVLVRDASKNPYFPTRIVDLGRYVDADSVPYTISRVLQPGSYNIDVREYLRELKTA